MNEQPRHPRVSIAERIKSRYVHDLDALDDDCRQLIHELEIMRQDVAEARIDVVFKWTKGHANDYYNERADALASAGKAKAVA